MHRRGRGVRVWLRQCRGQPGEAEGPRDRGDEEAVAAVGGVRRASASWPSGPRQREYASRSIAGGSADGASLLSAGAGSVSGASTAGGGTASSAGEDEDKTSAVGGRRGGAADEPRYTTDYYSSGRKRGGVEPVHVADRWRSGRQRPAYRSKVRKT